MKKDLENMQSFNTNLSQASFWTVTRFGVSELDDYAVQLMEEETRSGLRVLCLVFILLLSASAILDAVLGLSGPYLYTYLVLAVLSTNIYFAARTIRDVRSLHLLGMTLLVISSTAMVLLAHKEGTFSIPLFIGVMLIYVVVPLIPWGLREAVTVITLIYLVFTLSTLNARIPFDPSVMTLLQFFMVSVGLIILILVARNAVVRKKEIKTLFELENAHRETRRLSFRDPLTDAWNRRYLQERYFDTALGYHQGGKSFYFVLFDVNNFKQINDSYGHEYGDRVLQWVAEAFSGSLKGHDLLVRMGGDEFALLVECDPHRHIQRGVEALDSAVRRMGHKGHDQVTMSFGLVRVAPGTQIELSLVYKEADKALYASKKEDGNTITEATCVPSGQSERLAGPQTVAGEQGA